MNVRIPLGEWLPDQPEHSTKGLMVANNCYPREGGYRPARDFVGLYTAGTAPFKGAASFTPEDGGAVPIGGTASNLYTIAGLAWTSLAGGFAVPATGRWRFAQFGNLGIATNGVDPIQKVDLTTLACSALGGSPPTAKTLAVVRDFLVGAVINGQTNVLAWSGINDAEYWTFGQRQSDYQIMPSGGDINGLFGGEFGIILQRSRITRMDYVGGNEIFVINEISSNFGCLTPYSVVQHGQMGFFLSDNGFMMWDGAQLRQIGNEKVDRTFLSTYARDDWPGMSVAVDTDNQVVVWSMGSTAYCYSWPLDRWTTLSLSAQVVFSGANLSTDTSELDTTFYVINSSNVLGRLIGPYRGPTWLLPTVEIAKGREALIRTARVDTDALTGISLGLASRERLGDGISENVYTTTQTNGDMPVRERGRYARVALSIAAGTSWTYANGVELNAVAGALR